MYRAQTPSSSNPNKTDEFDPYVNFRRAALENEIRNKEEVVGETEERLASGIDRVKQIDSGYFTDSVQEIEAIKSQGLADYQYLIDQFEKLKVDYNSLNNMGSTLSPAEAWKSVSADLKKEDPLFHKRRLFCDIEWVLSNPEVITVSRTDIISCQLGLLWQAAQQNTEGELGSNFISEDQLRAHFNLRKHHVPYSLQGKEAKKVLEGKEILVKEIVRNPLEICELAHQSLEDNENYSKSTEEFFMYLNGIQIEHQERARKVYTEEAFSEVTASVLTLPEAPTIAPQDQNQQETKLADEAKEVVRQPAPTYGRFDFIGTQLETMKWLIPEHKKAALTSRLGTDSIELNEFMQATLEVKTTKNDPQAHTKYILQVNEASRKALDDKMKKDKDGYDTDLTHTVSTMERELDRLKEEHKKGISRVRVYNGSHDELVEAYFGHYRYNLRQDYESAKSDSKIKKHSSLFIAANKQTNKSIKAQYESKIQEMKELRSLVIANKDRKILISDHGIDISIERKANPGVINSTQTLFLSSSRKANQSINNFKKQVDLCSGQSRPYQGYSVKVEKKSASDKVAGIACCVFGPVCD